ncbi:hypothetical protein DPMN_079976 [Dreissena polymorpha]|uniref:Uncharacterized protein n=1 Tax=Dreissena polymorpha TaxID=45954 RepID=A0A9D3YU42_DREPO|nr:hypothetical protein DPMN_079976 [Dreissena polymorpha]
MTRHHQQIPRHHAEACRGDQMRSASADRRGYSATRYPGLAPMDFRVFPEVKSQLRGIRFASKQELTVAARWR